MNWREEWKILILMVGIFLVCWYIPVGSPRFDTAVLEAFHLVKWYAQEHVLLCLVPAFFIAGAIGVFVSQAAVMRYLGAGAKKALAYGVASVSGTVLAVCSCTVLPLFAGIYRMGAGLGPACAFLYSGPAINVLAIVLTARILGPDLGVARAVGAVAFSLVVGIAMAFFFRRDECQRLAAQPVMGEEVPARPLWQTAIYFALMVAILVFANWGRPQEEGGLWAALFAAKWWLTSGAALGLAAVLVAWLGASWWKVGVSVLVTAVLALFFPREPVVAFTAGTIGLSWVTSTDPGEGGAWFSASWTFAKQILPLLLGGVLVAGFLLGRVGHEGIIPSGWVAGFVGGNSLGANFFASVVGAFMYFATLTEVPIVQGLLGAGMGKGPALALLLAGPALSLPNMLVINSIMGARKTIVFVSLVVAMATVTGWVFGAVWG